MGFHLGISRYVKLGGLLLWILTTLEFKAQTNFEICTSLSQKSNHFIFSTREKQVFISSLEGLNIFDGLHTKVYRPATHNMEGLNIQSTFYEDTTGKVWFTTYQALNWYNPETDDLEYTFMVTSNGDTLDDNYKAFHFDSSTLYLKAGKQVFAYNVYTRQITSMYDVNFRDRFRLAICHQQGINYLFGGDWDGYDVYRLDRNGSAILLHSGLEGITSLIYDENGFLWLGHLDGRISFFDPVKGERMWYGKITGSSLIGITALSNTRLLISTSDSELLEFDIPTRKILRHFQPMNNLTGKPVRMLRIPYLDGDSTLWIGGEDEGVFFTKLRKRKFEHFLAPGPTKDKVSVRQIIPVMGDKLLILTEVGGIYIINRSGEILQHWISLPEGNTNFESHSGVLLDPSRLLFVSSNQLYVLHLLNKTIQHLEAHHDIPNFQILQLERLQNGQLVASCMQNLMMEILLEENAYKMKPYAQLQTHTSLTTYFKEDKEGRLYVSDDEKNIIVLEPVPEDRIHKFTKSIPISGGIKCIAQTQLSGGIFIGNTEGLFHLDPTGESFTKVLDPEKWLDQTIYSMLADDHGELWMGTNKGLLKFNPKLITVKVFSLADGVQESGFNTHASVKLPDGFMVFGGVNGINYFDPTKVLLSNDPAPIWISNVMIDDELQDQCMVEQYCSHYELSYNRNTISFNLHAIDFSDPEATRVKYKLIGIDKDYVVSERADGFIRYANLWPDTYTLSVIGANSDGIWNDTAREITITINPPFYLTWGFLSLSSAIVLYLIYWLVKSYYKRKLEKKNQLLREQALLIEKHQAVEKERTRIASEMHDDLGSGLTTIRYLSDKALKQAKDEAEASQIRRIAEHSNHLVRNMSEIIWAMNGRFDNAGNLVSYLRRYASEFLAEHNIRLKFSAPEIPLESVGVSGERRRNLFLVFKELLHNTVKYSGSSEVEIEVQLDNNVSIHILETRSPGFDPQQTIEKGNGLYNCRKRMESIQGSILFEKKENGMNISFSAPIES